MASSILNSSTKIVQIRGLPWFWLKQDNMSRGSEDIPEWSGITKKVA